MIKAYIVDDERKAILVLKNLVERLNFDIQVVAEFQQPKMALEALKTSPPDLVFLDITMPEITGLELLKQIENPDFEVIFVTAHNEYAIEAIQHCAIGYIVKPINSNDLTVAIENAKKNIEQRNMLAKNQQLVKNLSTNFLGNRKIAIPSDKGLDFVEIQSILYCEGAKGYTVLHLKNEKQIVSSYSIGHFNRMLENNGFYLVHKSYIVNLEYIRRYDRVGIIELDNGKGIPVARNRRESFLNKLKS